MSSYYVRNVGQSRLLFVWRYSVAAATICFCLIFRFLITAVPQPLLTCMDVKVGADMFDMYVEYLSS